jgi:6-phosphogluconolactonase
MRWSGQAMSVPMGIYVYVSNADDGDVGIYALQPEGTLQPRGRARAGIRVGPMAVSPDRRFLYAGVRSKPYSVHTFAIDPGTGALRPVSVSPLAESMPYIALDRTGRFLFGASYNAHLVSVNAVDGEGRVAPEPLQLIPVGRNAHSIRADESNSFVYVPTLGSDQIFQFSLDPMTGRLASNTPAVCMMQAGTGPRHFVTSRDNRFLYVLSELLGTVTRFELNGKSGLLREMESVSGLPPESKLKPGAPRGPAGAAGVEERDTEQDIWAADIHLSPDGRFIYISERTSSILTAFAVDSASGTLAYVCSVPTERQPRGFAIDPGGRFLVAAGEKSDTISLYAIDQKGGALRWLQRYPAGKGGNWVECVGFD